MASRVKSKCYVLESDRLFGGVVITNLSKSVQEIDLWTLEDHFGEILCIRILSGAKLRMGIIVFRTVSSSVRFMKNFNSKYYRFRVKYSEYSPLYEIDLPPVKRFPPMNSRACRGPMCNRYCRMRFKYYYHKENRS